MTNKKIIFVPNAWVKCLYEGRVCLGRTFLDRNKAKNKLQMISLVCETGELILVEYSLVRKVVILKILTITEYDKEFSICKKVKSQDTLNQLSKALSQYQLKAPMS